MQATASAGGVDAAARCPVQIVDTDAQHAGGRARADPLCSWGVAAAVLGQLLFHTMQLLNYRQAGLIIFMIIVTVAIMDFVSAQVRRRLI